MEMNKELFPQGEITKEGLDIMKAYRLTIDNFNFTSSQLKGIICFLLINNYGTNVVEGTKMVEFANKIYKRNEKRKRIKELEEEIYKIRNS